MLKATYRSDPGSWSFGILFLWQYCGNPVFAVTRWPNSNLVRWSAKKDNLNDTMRHVAYLRLSQMRLWESNIWLKIKLFPINTIGNFGALAKREVPHLASKIRTLLCLCLCAWQSIFSRSFIPRGGLGTKSATFVWWEKWLRWRHCLQKREQKRVTMRAKTDIFHGESVFCITTPCNHAVEVFFFWLAGNEPILGFRRCILRSGEQPTSAEMNCRESWQKWPELCLWAEICIVLKVGHQRLCKIYESLSAFFLSLPLSDDALWKVIKCLKLVNFLIFPSLYLAGVKICWERLRQKPILKHYWKEVFFMFCDTKAKGEREK